MHDPVDGLFGREPQLAALASAVEAAILGRPAFVLVTGEAGIGKTRVLRAAAARGHDAGVMVRWGTAIESGRGVPYLPLIAPLREAIAHAEAARTPGAAPDRALDAVRRALDGGPIAPAASQESGIDGARLVEAIYEVLTRTPTLLVIDDVHWADDSTLTVLDYLAHRASDVPLVVFAAARDEVPAALARLPIADGRRFVRLPVDRLGVQDVRRQAAALLGAPIPADRAASLHRRTAGNPFFVEQVLAGSDAPPGPASLRAMVLRRIVDLAPGTRAVLEALAVIGHAAAVGRIALVAAIGQVEVHEALRDAAAGGITVGVDEGIAFRHPLFGEVIEAELDGPRRRELHARAASAAETAGADPSEVADHWWHSDDRTRAWASAMAAAAAATRAYAFAEVRLHLGRALHDWPAGTPGRDDALLDAARATWLAGDPVDALALAQEARALAPDRVDAIVASGSYAWDAGRRTDAVAAFREAEPLIETAGPAIRARVRWGLGRAAVATGEPATATAYGLEVSRIGKEIGDRVLASEGLTLAGMSRAFDGSLDGIEWVREAETLAFESGAIFGAGHGYQFLADLLGLDGADEEALVTAVRGIDACTRLGLARTHGSDLRGRAALLLLARGRHIEAGAVLADADPRAFPALASALLAMRRGRFEEAAAELDRAATLGAIGGPGSLGGWLELARVELAWLRTDPADAARWAAAVPPMPGVWGDDVRGWAARWQARLGAPGGAVSLVERHPAARVRAALVAEISALETVDPAAAPAAWRLAVEAWEAAHRPWEMAWARLAEAEASFAVREAAAGRAALEAVLAVAQTLDSPPLRAHAETLARRARIRIGAAVRGRASHPDAPTDRELEVLVLLAEGLTNPQIAGHLFLSPKTVGIHVARLLAKLGAHTRGEAVAVARRRGLID